MHMKCLDCNYGCGTPHTLLFQYKIEYNEYKLVSVHVEIKQ